MSKDEALAWYKSIQSGGGTHDERMKYLERFGVGEVAERLWDSGEFTYGIEYGILIAIAKIFELSDNDLK